jgi:hypothetical protein
MEGDLVIAVRGDLYEVPIPGLTRIDAKLLARLAPQHIPGALDISGGEGFAVVPGNASTQSKPQVSALLIP